jgi:hypothetical protein
MAESLAIHACVGENATHSEVEIISPGKPWCAKPSLPSSSKSFKFRSQLHGPHHQRQACKLPPNSPTIAASSTSPNSPRTQLWPNSCSTHFFFPPVALFLSVFPDYLLYANVSWGVILSLWILILWTLSLRTFGKLKIVWIIAGFTFWVCGLIQFLWICGILIDQEIRIHRWASFLPAWLMFIHVEEVKALVISSLYRLVV